MQASCASHEMERDLKGSFALADLLAMARRRVGRPKDSSLPFLAP